MWTIIIFTILFFVALALAVSALMKDRGTTLFYGGASLVLFVATLLAAYDHGTMSQKILTDGNYYEVIVTTSVPSSVGTLIYAVDLDGNKEKADILAEYPIDGYKIEQIGERTFLLPIDTLVALDKEGLAIFVSEGGMAVSIPPVTLGR